MDGSGAGQEGEGSPGSCEDKRKWKHLVFAHLKLSFGGGERVLIEQVAALANCPVRVSVVYRIDEHRRDIEEELRARNPNVERVDFVPTKWKSLWWILRIRPDAVMVCDHRPFLKGLRILAQAGFRRPAMVTAHEPYPSHVDRYGPLGMVISGWLIDYDFAHKIRHLIGARPVHVVKPLYPRQEAVPWGAAHRLQARAELGLPDQALVVGYIGQQEPHKESWRLLAFAEALEACLGREVHVLFAGREHPDVARTMDEAVAASPLKARVHRLGVVPDIDAAFQALDLFVLASRQEGFFPLSLIEALERGVPVAATQVGGIPSVLVEGRGGFLIHKPDDQGSPSGEAIREAAQRVAVHMGSPEAWQAQRELAAELIRDLRDPYDAEGLYRKILLELMA